MEIGQLLFVILVPTFVVYVVAVCGSTGVDSFRRSRVGGFPASQRFLHRKLGIEMRWNIESVGATFSLCILGVGISSMLILPERTWIVAAAIPTCLLFFVWICHIHWPRGGPFLKIIDVWSAFVAAASLVFILPGS